LKKVGKKSGRYGGYFFHAAAVLLLFSLAYNQLAEFKKSKRNVRMGLDYLIGDNLH
jgi:hypothetical protein